MARAATKFTDQIRLAVAMCGESRYAISKATGIPQSALSRFVHGERGLSVELMDRLAEYLGLEVIVKRRRPRGK
jgi:plasmid maintenance system antidote protein VapI